jgi:DNA invertase Pin-like site-specific DNA recombinase
MSEKIEKIEIIKKLEKELFLSKNELAREIGINIETLRRVLNPNYTGEFTLKTKRLVKNFIEKHREDN